MRFFAWPAPSAYCVLLRSHRPASFRRPPEYLGLARWRLRGNRRGFNCAWARGDYLGAGVLSSAMT
jgi:hypothetical protein